MSVFDICVTAGVELLRREEKRAIAEAAAKEAAAWSELQTIEALQQRLEVLWYKARDEWKTANEERVRHECGLAFPPPTASVQ